MALTPETQDALSQALDAVVQECGHDPQYAQLVEHLTAAQAELGQAGGADHPDAQQPGQPADPHGFGAAESAHRQARAGGQG